jgi:calcium-dependent protein kinase
MATISKESVLSKANLDKAFKMVDKDNNGRLSLEEIKECFGGAGIIEDHVWKEIINEVDEDGNGEVIYLL